LDVRIVSGGQTGVDRAALDAARRHNLPSGGWCPKGRRAEDGTIPARYSLTETPSPDYRQRTEWNVRDADATLVLVRGRVGGGTAYTLAMARRHAKPWLVIDLAQPPPLATVRAWLRGRNIQTLNVAGPRASTHPDIHAQALAFLDTLLADARA
jgi:predicted Rossmann-fold nucleotide-binding protein